MVPKQDQSGNTDKQLGITKKGNKPGRKLLVLRLSLRLDKFYEKIGVKSLGLLYAIVCRLQVPK